jgi:hypothetical protein
VDELRDLIEEAILGDRDVAKKLTDDIIHNLPNVYKHAPELYIALQCILTIHSDKWAVIDGLNQRVDICECTVCTKARDVLANAQE